MNNNREMLKEYLAVVGALQIQQDGLDLGADPVLTEDVTVRVNEIVDELFKMGLDLSAMGNALELLNEIVLESAEKLLALSKAGEQDAV